MPRLETGDKFKRSMTSRWYFSQMTWRGQNHPKVPLAQAAPMVLMVSWINLKLKARLKLKIRLKKKQITN